MITPTKRKRGNSANTASTAASAFRVFVNRLAVQARQPGARADPLLYAAARTSRNAYTVAKPALNEHRKRVMATRALANWMKTNRPAKPREMPPATGNNVKKLAIAEATEHGNVDVVKRLLARGADPNVRFSSKQYRLTGTPLMLAVCSGYNKLVDVLIQGGADLEAKDSKHIEYTPLMLAVESGNIMMARKLLKAGAQVNNDVEGIRALHVAFKNRKTIQAINAGEKMAILLLSAGADPNPPDVRSSFRLGSPLSEAIQHYITRTLTMRDGQMNSAVVDRLISAGANVNGVMHDGRSLLEYVVLRNSPQLVGKLLAAGADPNVMHNDFLVYIRPQMLPILCKACNLGDGYLRTVEQLLKGGAPVDSRNIFISGHSNGRTGDTALICAASSNHPSAKVMTMLLDAGANPKARGEMNATALMRLCGKETLSVLEVAVLRRLLKLGASVNDKDSEGSRPLYYAKRAKNKVAIRELLAAGADPTKI